jgi:hypothetical protein
MTENTQPETPIAPPIEGKKANWKVIIPAIVLIILCCLCLLVAGILAYIGTQGKGPLAMLATDTPTRTPTPTFTPTPSYVSVAVYNHDTSADISYWTGGVENSYETYQDVLEGDPENRFRVGIVYDLSSSTLSGYDRLILPDNAVPDDYLDEVREWLWEGNNVIAVDSAITYVSYDGLMWEESHGTNGEDTYWDYSSDEDDLLIFRDPITEDIFVSYTLSSDSGDAQMYGYMLPYDARVLAESAYDSTYIYAACRRIPSGGNVFVLGPFESPEDDLYPFIREVVYAPGCE